MDKKLFIHAGTEKTGSTSLQDFLLTNGKSLEDHGFHFLKNGGVGATGAMKLTATFCHPKMRLGELAYQNSHVLQRQVIAEVRQSNCRNFIISSEHLHSRVQSPTQIDELKSVFHTAGITEIKVIFYIRNQIDLIRSHYSTQIKGGGANTYRNAFSKIRMKSLVPRMVNSYGNYGRMLDLWSNAFGTDNIIVRNYDRTHDVISSFLEIIGIPVDVPAFMKNTKPRLNTSLDRTSVFILSNFNNRYPKNKDTYAWLRNTLQDLKLNYHADPMPLSVQLRIWLNFLWSNYLVSRKWPELRGLSRRGFVWGSSNWYRKPTDIETDLIDLLALLGKKELHEADTAPALLLDIRESMGSRGVLHKGFEVGFHKPEEWGCWTRENVAVLTANFPGCKAGDLQRIILRVRLRSYHKAGDVPSLANIFINETLVFSGLIFNKFELLEIDVPLDSVAPGLSNRILFETNTLISPSEAGVSPDSRKLGLGISHMELHYVLNETNGIAPSEHRSSDTHEFNPRS